MAILRIKKIAVTLLVKDLQRFFQKKMSLIIFCVGDFVKNEKNDRMNELFTYF